MEHVETIAKWFLAQESMTHKKLQKMCYYAQAWYCALYDGAPLFEEEIQAWVHGPVVPALYPRYADYRWLDIPKEEHEPELSKKITDVLYAVYDTYADYTGDQLERLTHSEDPWIIARNGIDPWETSTSVITCVSMRKYYGKKYREGQND